MSHASVHACMKERCYNDEDWTCLGVRGESRGGSSVQQIMMIDAGTFVTFPITFSKVTFTQWRTWSAAAVVTGAKRSTHAQQLRPAQRALTGAGEIIRRWTERNYSAPR